MNPAGVLISRTWSTGRLGNLLANLLGTRTDDPYLGCMGHQCIGQAFGGMVPSGLMHGRTSPVTHLNKGAVEGLTRLLSKTATHSLVRRGLAQGALR
jgi:anthranilate synthase component 2